MIIQSTFDPTLALSKDETRPALNTLHLDTAAKRLVSTDGHIMAILPVEIEDGDTTGPITSEAFKAARKDQKKSGIVEIKANGCIALPNGATFPRPEVGPFPLYQQVIPEPVPVHNKPGFKIAIDARLLFDLAVALGGEKGKAVVTLSFGDKDSPIRVTRSDNDSLGILMPVRM